MKEKIRTLLIAGGILVAILAVVVLIPTDALEPDYPDNLSEEEIASLQTTIKESEQAIQDFKKENREPQTLATEYQILGAAHRRLGELRQARQAYEKALEYVPGDVEMVRAAGEIAVEEGNYDAARAIYERAIESDPTNFAFWNLEIELEKAHFGLAGDELETQLREAIDATDRSIGSLVSLANYLEYEKQDYAGALALWKEAAAKNPTAGDIYAKEIADLEAKVANPPSVETPE